MNMFSDIIIDADGILGLIFWIIVVAVGSIILLLILGAVFGFIGEVFETTNDAAQIVNKKISKNPRRTFTIGQMLIYVLITFVLGTGLTFALIEVLPDDLWFIAIIPFFCTFPLCAYFANRVKKLDTKVD